MSNPTAHEPKYIRLMAQLRQLIAGMQQNGENCLPSERELCEKYGVSRVTVRRALSELEQNGSISRVHGKGAFISTGKLQQPLLHLTSFTEDMQRRRLSSSSKILAMETVSALPDVAAKLRIREGDPVVLLKRLRNAGGRPIALETCYLNHQLGSMLREHMVDNASLYALLRSVCGVELAMAEQSIEVGILQPWEQALFGDDAPAFALYMTRQTFDSNDQVVECVESKYRGDSYAYHIRIAAE